MLAIPGYKIIKKVHESARTLVLRGVKSESGESVIIKISPKKYPPPEDLIRLKREFELGTGVRHKNVSAYLDLVQIAFGVALIEEDISAISLERYIPEQGLEIEEFLPIAISICEGLEEIHRVNLIHCDIKPTNIIINPENLHVRIIDFGIASRIILSLRQTLSPGKLEGTLAYMSPEQTGRTNQEVDYRTDFYSLGATFFHLLTGRPPFLVKDSLDIVHCHLARPIPSIREFNPSHPNMIDAIIRRLCEKNAEERYQSASSLRDDLEECLRQFKKEGDIQSFIPGANDTRGRFRIPQKLYGRDAERDVLLQAFERIRQNDADTKAGVELLIVAGYSGVGKSSLVYELHKSVTEQGGYFVSGKFDKFRRNTSFYGVRRALNRFCNLVLAENEIPLGNLRENILEAMGGNIGTLIELIPNLKLIFGPRSPVSQEKGESGDLQANNIEILRRFISVISRPEHPLVIFFDDLHWADIASLNFLEDIALERDKGSPPLLIVGAYRNNEVEGSHPLANSLKAIRSAGGTIRSLNLENPGLDDLNMFVAETLDTGVLQCYSLAKIIYDKTGGNPLFFSELLKSLYTQGLLKYETVVKGGQSVSSWKWNLDEIITREFSANVVDRMVEKITSLEENTRRILALGACMGHIFDLQTLAFLRDSDPRETLGELWSAMEAGYLIPLDENFKIIRYDDRGRGLDTVSFFKFQHERVQQAAYILLDVKSRAPTHWQIGNLLKNNNSEAKLEEKLFDIVNHLNLGRVCLASIEEKKELRDLNFRAGVKAKSASAYTPAREYFHVALTLDIPGFIPETDKVFRDLKYELAHVEFLNANFDEARDLSEYLLEITPQGLERSKVYELKINILQTSGDFVGAVDTGLFALREYGLIFPSRPSRSVAMEQARRARDLLSRLDFEDPGWSREPSEYTDVSAVLSLLNVLFVPALFCDENLKILLLSHMARFGLEHGVSGESAAAFALYGAFILGPIFHDYQDAARLAEFACVLVKKYDFRDYLPVVFLARGDIVNPWTRPLKENWYYLKESFRTAVETGNIPLACFCCNHMSMWALAMGRPLEDVRAYTAERLLFVRRAGYKYVENIILSIRQFARDLSLEEDESLLYGEAFDPEAFEKEIENGMPLAHCWRRMHRMKALYYLGRHEEAYEQALVVLDLVWSSGEAHVEDMEFFAYYPLVLTAIYDKSSREQKRKLLTEALLVREKMEVWARNSPINFKHKLFLIQAELARVKQEHPEAIRFYEQAANEARDNGFAQYEALASELAAVYFLSLGNITAAEGYLRRAYGAYRVWGAGVKISQLENVYPWLKEIHSLSSASEQSSRVDLTELEGQGGDVLDFITVTRASQAISGEIDLGALLRRMMKIVLENAGARRGCFLLESDDKLRIQALADLNGTEVLQNLPLEDDSFVPESLILRVWRGESSIVLNDVQSELEFQNSTYFKEKKHRLKSILCMPLLRQNVKIGVLYLENDLTRGAFTGERTRVLNTLMAQAAISLENSRLYEKMSRLNQNLEREVGVRKEAESRVRRFNEKLEERVAIRTRELNQANKDLEISNRELESFSYSVSHDLRSPLRHVQGYSKMLEEDFGEALGERGLKYLERIIRGCSRMNELIEDILRLANVARKELEFNEVNLSLMAREILRALKDSAPERQVEIFVQDELKVRCDSGLIRNVLENLLGNAWKYSAKNPPERLPARIEFGVNKMKVPGHSRGSLADVYFVKDNGAGFDMKFAHKLFEVFQRLHGDEEFEGTGVGLATVQRIIERHDGVIWAESVIGTGATFFFTLSDS